MRTDGEATRERILVAAGSEFAEFGLAGARVDRIAAAANASKERLYAYFGDKRTLFVAVLNHHMSEVTDSIPVDSSDLPGFVGTIFDFAQQHPEHFRMMDWARLGGDFDLVPAVPASVIERDAAAIVEAQARGLVDPEWDAHELFTLLFTIATSSMRLEGVSQVADDADEAVARRRATAVRAATKLLAP
ncbi:TetR family transcriptional regulator [Conyzicola sp.]|uniref:TetR/AcrR family transcriptional regulator n=1 Tax=Conyzicola sp. TaxID=1969404 RepID=UPI003988F93A